MNGKSLEFDFDRAPPASKNIDPETSAMAEHEITIRGKRAGDCQLILDALRKYENCTSAELAEHMKPGDRDWRYTVARRLPDLKNHSPAYATQGNKRICTKTGKMAVTWACIKR